MLCNSNVITDKRERLGILCYKVLEWYLKCELSLIKKYIALRKPLKFLKRSIIDMVGEEVSLNPIKCPIKMREGRKRGNKNRQRTNARK